MTTIHVGLDDVLKLLEEYSRPYMNCLWVLELKLGFDPTHPHHATLR